ncbi:MAG TPA: hypothetical protein VF432_15075 [Thermoanaerobaculia bacterium]
MSDQKIPLPADFDKQVKAWYDKLANPEVSLAQFSERATEEFQRQRAIESDRALAYKPSIGSMTPCGNGTLEQSLDPTEWQGAYGALMSGGGINFATLTAGILSGPINSGAARQTWVGAGTDPNVGIPTTAHGSAGAVRIGNAVNGYGCELLSKTFVVTPGLSTISFWYAVVLQNPAGHSANIQPFFQVRVTDAAGAVVPGAFDFGGGSDTIVADMTNPFFQSTTIGGEPVVYRDWSCAQLKLGSMIGKQVTVEFVTADCGAGGHWGYAYIDSFCGSCKGSPTGNLDYDCEASTHCGPGQICFAYTLPKTKDAAGNTITGTVTIALDVYQNGVLLTQFTSPVLNSGTGFCFKVTPASIPGINASLGGFDFVATGTFAIGSSSLGTLTVGAPPDGIKPGLNNDYGIACATCEDIEQAQNEALQKRCGHKVNLLPRVDCHCPDPLPQHGDCRCDCKEVKFPDIEPCISVSWGDSKCECFETDDVEILCITVCNCYSNVTFRDLSIGRIRITDMLGNPVPVLPDGTPSVQVIPSGPICFGDIKPCRGKNQPGCVSRELVVYTRGAVGKDYRLSFEGVCFTVSRRFQSEQCFLVKLCQD